MFRVAVPVWDIYTYDPVQRLTHAEYGSASGLAKLEDLAGDVGFAAAVGAQWLSSDEAFIDLARQRVREVRRRQKGLYRALAEAGLDGLPAADGGGRRPVLALVDFGAEETVEDDETLTYEMIRDTAGEVIAIVIADGQGRVTLLTMYPAIGGTVVVSIRYDEWGEAVAKLCSTYDEQGNLVDVVDLLATEITEVHRAETLVSSEPSVASVAEASLDGGMMTMSTPTAPPAATEAFVYDRLGNRVTYTDKEGYPTTYAHNGLNQYTHVHRDLVWDLEEDYWPEHDANGNLSRDRYGYVYSYDYRNRLTRIAGELTFGYDALGRRVMKADDDAGVTTYFYYDPFGRVIAEYEKPDGGSAALARVFVYGNGIDEVLAMFTPYHAGDPADWDEFLDFCGVWLLDSNDPGYDDAFDVVDDNVIDLKDFAVLAASWDLPSSEESDWYYLHDALGSVIGIVGARFGRESDREFYLYDVYGQPDVLPTNGNPYLFTGRRYDWVDDDRILYYLRARHYSPLTGRFLQPDPIGYADSPNLYEYVTSNPTNYIDPWGLWSEKELTPEELQKLLTEPGSADLEKVCDDQMLCNVSDLLKFREGRLTLLTYLFGGGVPALEQQARGMTGVNVAAALENAYTLDDALYLGDFFLTAGEVREPYRRACYLRHCEEKLKKLTAKLVTEAVMQAATAGAAKGVPLLLRTAQYFRGPTVWQGMSPCMDDLARVAGQQVDDLIRDASVLDDLLTSYDPGVPFTYRGDATPPSVVFREGFRAKGASTDLYRHALNSSNPPSAFVSTSKSFDVASGFGGRNVYAVRPRNGLDVNAILGPRSPFPHEMEVAVPWRIPASDIPGFTPLSLEREVLGLSVLNPRYIPR